MALISLTGGRRLSELRLVRGVGRGDRCAGASEAAALDRARPAASAGCLYWGNEYTRELPMAWSVRCVLTA